MKCPYCAETIQDAAILCRFCGAQRVGEEWRRPTIRIAGPPKPKGFLTLQITGYFWIISGIFEATSVTSPVALFGDSRGGLIAWIYHLAWIALFAGLSVAYLKQKPWGYRLTLIGTAFLTLDKALFLLDSGARDAELMRAVGGNHEVLDLLGEDFMQSFMVLSAVLSVLCWWGLVAYVHYRRAYFTPPVAPLSSSEPF